MFEKNTKTSQKLQICQIAHREKLECTIILHPQLTVSQ